MQSARSNLQKFGLHSLKSGYHRRMMNRPRFIYFAMLLGIVSWVTNQIHASTPILDPMADYLAMKVPDRATNVGRLLVVKRVTVDLLNDGEKDLFVGTWYRNSGPDTWLWVGYKPIPGGYVRINDSDILIDFNGIFVGELPQIGKYGMAQAYSLELTHSERSQSNMISDLSLYFVEDNQLVQKSLGPLDLDDPEQKTEFDFYFGSNRKMVAAPVIESFTIQELVQRGYKMPDWTR
jgi:hypothetical protein